MAWAWFKRLFSVPTDDADLLRAQFEAFCKQMPLLYFILSANSLIVSYTFAAMAPAWLSVYLPLALCLVCVNRAAWWWQRRNRAIDDAQILSSLRRTNRVAPALAICFTFWGLSLYQYGDAYAQGQVAFYMALTVIGCIFCLMHLRSAALSVTLLVNIPYILFFFFEGHATLKAIAVNLALVCAAMVNILVIYYRDFANLVVSRRALIDKQAETQSLSDENFRLANLDSLSGLPNRRWFFAHLRQHFEGALARSAPFAIGVIDLDGFKPVNDIYGHATGDLLLQEVGRRLEDLCRASGPLKDVRIARLGGDEFAVLVPDDPGEAGLQALGESITHALGVPFVLGTVTTRIGGSAGFARYPESGDTPDILFERADYALYFAKRQKRGGTVMFNAAHEAQIRKDSIIDKALLAANLKAEMSLRFQPIIDMTNGQVRAFEALARWESPTLGTVAPSVFITAAERNGLIGDVTRHLLGLALIELGKWPQDVHLSFNLSARDLASSEMLIHLIAMINQSGLSPARLDFEITETAMVQDFAQASAGFTALKALGVGISLDDFGTGYSSLTHLHRLAFDTLKIDQSFIGDITDNPASLKIVKSLTALCADMGLKSVVEGVETEAQFTTLRGLGCHLAQGYYFARPMLAEEIHAYLGQTNAHVPWAATGRR
jgi:diguanylate cyclase (GGDEF)-like protein